MRKSRAIVSLIAISLTLVACVRTGQPATETPQPVTPTASATGTASAQPLTPSATTTPSGQPTATPSVAKPQPSPSSSPVPSAVEELRPPLVVDSERGRLYIAGLVDGQEQIVALDARDGELAATYPISGPFAVDGLHGWLYVDRGADGLAVVNLQTATVHDTIVLPPTELWREPAPTADPATGQVLVFRNNEVLFIDPQEGEVIDKLVLGVQADPSSCGTQGSALPIQDAVYDAQQRVLHLEFMTYVCTPWSGYTIVSHEMDTRKELGRRRGAGPTAQATAYDGYLFGSSWYRMGFGYRWALHDLQLVAESVQWQGGLVDWTLDTSRARLYEPAGGFLRVYDGTTMALQMVVPSPVAGQLVGYDSGTDQLYFLAEGQLRTYSAADVQTPVPQPLVASQPPTTTVRSLIVSPEWPQDQTLFAIWDVPQPAGDCWVFGQQHGLLLISPDGGGTWKRPPALEFSCGYVSSLAMSATYAEDRMLLAGLPGLGLWKSTDAGRSWQPLSGDLPSMGISQILLSPAWAKDQTAFVRTVSSADLYRTKDGGKHWELLETSHLQLVDMSTEFAQDRTLMGMAWELSDLPGAPPNEVLLSADEGQHWHHAGELGASRTASVLSMAPLFAKWQVVFVHGDDGWLYRSENGGAHWVPVLHTPAPERDPFNTSPRLVYAPGIEERRPLFLLVTDSEYTATGQVVRGTLFRSSDGGHTWQEVALPATMEPTAIAVSPAFEEDGLLFLGLADGRIVAWSAR